MKSNACLRHLLRSSHASVRCAHQVRLFSTGDSPCSLNDTVRTSSEKTAQLVTDRDTYLFGEKKSFSSCGLGAELVTALESAGKLHPTVIQAKVITAVETGKDVIVGAETGSGKTLSYLLPIINGLLRECASKSSEEIQPPRSYPHAIIVVPNKELCSQVHRMASEILTHLPRQYDISVG